jgi:hypothetical protein
LRHRRLLSTSAQLSNRYRWRRDGDFARDDLNVVAGQDLPFVIGASASPSAVTPSRSASRDVTEAVTAVTVRTSFAVKASRVAARAKLGDPRLATRVTPCRCLGGRLGRLDRGRVLGAEGVLPGVESDRHGMQLRCPTPAGIEFTTGGEFDRFGAIPKSPLKSLATAIEVTMVFEACFLYRRQLILAGLKPYSKAHRNWEGFPQNAPSCALPAC